MTKLSYRSRMDVWTLVWFALIMGMLVFKEGIWLERISVFQWLMHIFNN